MAVLVVTGTGTMYLSQRFAPFHILFVNIGIVLIGLHALAVLWHQFIRRDALLLRMLPAQRRADAAPGISVPVFGETQTTADSAISETNLI